MEEEYLMYETDSACESGGDEENRVEEEEFQYNVLSTEEIVHHMVDCVKEVNSVVQIPPTTTRILLHHLKWNSEKLYEWYYGDNRDSLFKEANISNPQKRTKSKTKVAKKSKKSKRKPQLEVCEICYTDVPHYMMTGLECGDRFCSECWTAYLTTKIMDEGSVQRLTCAAQTCDEIIDDQVVMNLVKDRDVRLRFQHLITNSFVECNRLLRWCPSPGCNNAIKVPYVDSFSITCTCGHSFCFSCAENCHDPVKCNMLKKWLKKCSDDSETSNWIAANTKECPKCNATIQKTGGCNHVICKSQSCQFHFCWVCLGPWKQHRDSWYKCNQYDEERSKAARDAQQKSRAALHRYLFYCKRYVNHMKSLKFEKKLYDSVEKKMAKMQQYTSWIEVQFLKEAVDVLCQCRQTLMYTYVFAYYLTKNNQSVIFEHNQCDLETATEQLSEFLERDILEEDLLHVKQKVLDNTRYCKSRRKVLLEHVHEGYEKCCWEYNGL